MQEKKSKRKQFIYKKAINKYLMMKEKNRIEENSMEKKKCLNTNPVMLQLFSGC